MKIREIKENKKQFLSLLLLADEQENMIDRYLERGTMYVLNDNGVKAECVVTDEGNGILEIKNIATVPEYQGKGYAKALIDFIVKEYADKYSVLQVHSMKSAVLFVLISYRTFLQIIMTTQYLNVASGWWIW